MLKILDFYRADSIIQGTASIDAALTRKPGEFV
jgi:hypothetical protein